MKERNKDYIEPSCHHLTEIDLTTMNFASRIRRPEKSQSELKSALSKYLESLRPGDFHVYCPRYHNSIGKKENSDCRLPVKLLWTQSNRRVFIRGAILNMMLIYFPNGFIM